MYADATRIRNPAEIGLLKLKHNKENPTQLKISSNMKIFLFLKNIFMEIFSYTAKNMKIFSHLKIIAKLQKKENPTLLKIFIIKFYSCRDLAVFSTSNTSVFVRFGSPEEVPAVQATTPG